MQLIINGEIKEIDGVTTVQELLIKLGYETDSVAVARNEVFLSRSKYAETELNEGEKLEILQPMQGG